MDYSTDDDHRPPHESFRVITWKLMDEGNEFLISCLI